MDNIRFGGLKCKVPDGDLPQLPKRLISRSEIAMFDHFMHDTMPIWILISGLFPVFLIGMVVRAFLHLRRLRRLVENLPMPSAPLHVRTREEDWVPSP